MTSPRRTLGRTLAVAPCLVAASCVVSWSEEARADDTATVVTGLTVASTLVAANIAFTAYTAGAINDHREPSQAWMIGQTAITGAETLVATGAGIAIAHEDRKDEALSLLPIPVIIWTGLLSGFSSWSLADPNSANLQDRFLVSLLGATNLAFTSTAIGASVDGRFSPYYISIPEATLMAPASVLTAIKGGMDAEGRAGWVTLSIWSGVLTIHAIASIVGKATGADKPGSATDAVGPAPVTPTPDPIDPYYIDPAVPTPPPAKPPPPAAIPAPPPAVVPTPIPGGASLAPGLSVVGLF